jgi:hypothetical protein
MLVALLPMMMLTATVTPTARPSLTGTWSSGRPHQATAFDHRGGCALLVIEDKDDVQFEIQCEGFGPGQNMGTIDGRIRITDGKAVFKQDDGEFHCEVDFEFRGELAIVKQKGDDADCGLGHNVSVEGSYRRTSHKKPQISPEP